MKASEWSKEDISILDEISGSKSGSTAPLADSEYLINIRNSRNWRVQGEIFIPGNSIVRLFGESGVMRYANDGRSCGPSGSNAIAGSGFTVPTEANAHCFLVGVRGRVRIPGDPNGPDYWLRNTEIGPKGASIGTLGAFWEIATNDSGGCYTAFNDDFDRDNSGEFQQRIRIIPMNVFARSL